MKVPDRLYWFSRNLSAFILSLLITPVSWIWFILEEVIILFTNTNGSKTITFPWKYQWKWWEE